MRFPFFILILLAAGAVYFLNTKHFSESLVLYGFAETKETEINLNHAIHVESINVVPGQKVNEGTLLLKGVRLHESNAFDDADMRINEIQTKLSARRKSQKGRIDLLDIRYQEDLNTIRLQLEDVDNKIAFQKKVYEGLSSVKPNAQTAEKLLLQKKALVQKQDEITKVYQQQKNNIERDLSEGEREDREIIKRIKANQSHKENIAEVPIEILAPTNGIIGNVHVKEDEHITDFRTLISFYEPNPSLVKAYVMEEQLVNVKLGDRFSIASANDETHTYTAEVSGLGSRIVEIPQRMRKVPTIKTYGREVIFQLPAGSKFLQNEKLVLRAVE